MAQSTRRRRSHSVQYRRRSSTGWDTGGDELRSTVGERLRHIYS
ncbi:MULTISPECIES: hypothetical protein [Fischerella]|nr:MULTISPECIES: hypothetical protein [Fischerella]